MSHLSLASHPALIMRPVYTVERDGKEKGKKKRGRKEGGGNLFTCFIYSVLILIKGWILRRQRAELLFADMYLACLPSLLHIQSPIVFGSR